MVNSISEARKIYEEKVIRRDVLKDDIEKLKKTIQEKSALSDETKKAQIFVKLVSTETQKGIEVYVSDLVTMALAAVFPDPYKFELKFVDKRNGKEAELIFSKNGHEINDILDFGGGGVADVANFALTVSLWALKKTRPVLINDEPDKFLHNPFFQERASQMMKTICEKLGVQIIIVSDQPNIISAADKIIHVENENGISIVKEIN